MSRTEWWNLGIAARGQSFASDGALQEAFDAYSVLASLGDDEAMIELGLLYQHEWRARPRSSSLAEHWLRLGARSGKPRALFCLGNFLLGTGMARQGLGLLRRAARGGEGGAAARLVNVLELAGRPKALHWYRRAAELGDPFGALSAALILERRSDRRSVQEAETLLRIAVRYRLADASEALLRVRSRLRELA